MGLSLRAKAVGGDNAQHFSRLHGAPHFAVNTIIYCTMILLQMRHYAAIFEVAQKIALWLKTHVSKPAGGDEGVPDLTRDLHDGARVEFPVPSRL
jgi:hypothetical protein